MNINDQDISFLDAWYYAFPFLQKALISIESFGTGMWTSRSYAVVCLGKEVLNVSIYSSKVSVYFKSSNWIWNNGQ